jgi:translation initiation factor IF-2
MRSENRNRNNRNERNGNGNKPQSYAGNYRNQSDSNYRYHDYDRESNDDARDYNTYNRSDAGRYSSYEGNYGRGNYENNYDRNYSQENNNPGRYATGSGRGHSNPRSWDSQEPGYYSTGYNYNDNDRNSSEYGGTRRRDEKNWGDGRNYASDYNNDGSYRHQEDRGFFSRVGDRIRDTWHDITDRDDTSDNMRRFKENDSYGRRSSSNSSYDNRGNYRPYPEGSRDDSYGGSAWARNTNRGAYGERRNEYGSYGPDRQDFNW